MTILVSVKHVWINMPSTFQQLHQYHGKRGLLVTTRKNETALPLSTFYFKDKDCPRSMAVFPSWCSEDQGE